VSSQFLDVREMIIAETGNCAAPILPVLTLTALVMGQGVLLYVGRLETRLLRDLRDMEMDMEKERASTLILRETLRERLLRETLLHLLFNADG